MFQSIHPVERLCFKEVGCCCIRWLYMVCLFVFARVSVCLYLYLCLCLSRYCSVRANVFVCMCVCVSVFVFYVEVRPCAPPQILRRDSTSQLCSTQHRISSNCIDGCCPEEGTEKGFGGGTFPRHALLVLGCWGEQGAPPFSRV